MSAPTGRTDQAMSARVVASATLAVSEVFGPTFQGEGPSLGRRCSFVRLGGCNLHCVWCDTPYTWDWTGQNGKVFDPRRELTKITTADVWAEVQRQSTGMLVVTGGEPLLQQDGLAELLDRAKRAGWWVEVETAGSVEPSSAVVGLVDGFNVSLKLANSGNDLKERQSELAISALQLSGKANWKFVVTKLEDLEEIQVLADAFDLHPIWVMPEGIDAETISARMETLADAVLERGWNLTTRLQILIWGNRRGA